MGRDRVSNLHNLFIFTYPAPISLTLCLPWQWLFLDQLCIALASAPSLQSAHSGWIPACCQPTGLYRWQRQQEKWIEGRQRLQHTKNIQKEKVFKSVWGKLLMWVEVIGQHRRSNYGYCRAKFVQTFKGTQLYCTNWGLYNMLKVWHPSDWTTCFFMGFTVNETTDKSFFDLVMTLYRRRRNHNRLQLVR